MPYAGSILDAAGVNIQAAGVEAGALTQFGTRNILHLGIGGGAYTDSVSSSFLNAARVALDSIIWVKETILSSRGWCPTACRWVQR